MTSDFASEPLLPFECKPAVMQFTLRLLEGHAYLWFAAHSHGVLGPRFRALWDLYRRRRRPGTGGGSPCSTHGSAVGVVYG